MTGRSNFFRRNAAFTLVELLVVVAVIALLIGVLLPALAGARSSGFQMKGAANQRQMVLGIIRWGNENEDAIPGINTSGRSLEDLDTEDTSAKLSRSADRPTQNWDWISPAIGADTMPEARADRFVKMWQEFGDPTVTDVIPASDVTNANSALTEKLNTSGGLTAPSVLMPASWQWTGNSPGSKRILQPDAEADVAELPSSWFPRLTNIGSESQKVAISDGYVNLDTLKVDGAIWAGGKPNVKADEYGAFCSSTPIKVDSINFFGPQSLEANLKKVFRHRDKMNAGFWDGHVTTLSIRESQNPSLWYPKGTVMGSAVTKTALEFVKANDILN